MRENLRGNAVVAAALLFGMLLITGGAWAVVTHGVTKALMKDAQLSAADWAAHLAHSLPDVESLLEGKPIDGDTRTFLEHSEELGHVFRFKLFDREGRLRLDSWDLDAVGRPGASLAAHNQKAADVLRTGRVHLEAEAGDGVSRPLYYAEAYHPLVIDGRPTGVIEIYLDQTVRTRELYKEFLGTVILVAALSTVAFLMPMGAFLWRSSQQVETQKQLFIAANHDSLTGLLNRAAFRRMVDRRIAADDRNPAGFHVLFLDLDKFKDVNDSKGHAVGDEVLRLVADRLRGGTRPEDRFCRLGGDEFAVFTRAGSDPGAETRLARRLIESLQVPFVLSDEEVNIGASVGIAKFPEDGRTSGELLKAADLALYQAKRQGRGTFCVYEASMEAERARRLEVEERLRQAIARKDYYLHYQPLYETDSVELAGFEALLRLKDGTGAPISPAEFIPIAEETGLIVPLGAAVLEDACRIATQWPEHLSVSVNLSPVQFESGNIVSEVRQALTATGLAPARLELEVTESILMRNPDAVAMQLDQLKDFGVSIALDDFGTGYSSLSYLWKFPFDRLKIDRSFINNLSDGDERSHQVLETVVALGEVLRLRITAEGVETQAQADEVKRMKIGQVQGYLYGAPMASEDVNGKIFASPKVSGAGA